MAIERIGRRMTTIGNTAIRWAAAACLVCLVPAPAAADIPVEERQALIDLYRSTHGEDWNDHTDWVGEPGSECEWFGGRCSGDHVQILVLDRNGLSGPLPARLNQLTALRSFSAKGNELTGPMPSLNGLRSLEYFEVSENQLTGALPDLSGLARLTSFHAAHNRLTGPLPRMTGLPALEFFEVSFNRLTGPLPPLDALTQLKALDLRDNDLTGVIPRLNGLPLLHDVYLDHNRLSGPVPDLRGMIELRYLRLSHNQLAGTIPDLSGAPNLQELDVAANQLTGGLPAPAARGCSITLPKSARPPERGHAPRRRLEQAHQGQAVVAELPFEVIVQPRRSVGVSEGWLRGARARL